MTKDYDAKNEKVIPGGTHSHDSEGQKLPEHRQHVTHVSQEIDVKETHHKPGEYMGNC